MQAYDIFMLIVLMAAVAWGFWKGFAWQVASLASIALSYFISLNFRVPIASFLTSTTNTKPPWNIFLAMLILFLTTSLVVWLSFNFVSDIIERMRLKEFDRQVGAIFGFVKGVVLCVIITLFAVTLLGEARCQAICNSRSGHYIAWLLVQAEVLMPQEVQQVLAPYVAPHQHDQPFPNYTNNGVTPQAENTQYPQYPEYPQSTPGSQYQPNNAYDPRYGSQPTFGSQPATDLRR